MGEPLTDTSAEAERELVELVRRAPVWKRVALAASLTDATRATADIDLVADVPDSSVSALVTALGTEFYVDETAVRRAVRDRRSFNAIHLDSMLKIEVFVAPPSGFRRAQLEHGQPEVLDPGSSRTRFS